MAKSKNKTTKPSGLTITRSTNTYTCKWKIGGDNYGGGQKLEYSKNGGKWTAGTVSKTATSFTVTDASLKSLKFRVMGCKKKYKKNGKTITPKWSDWAESTAWTATKPDKPTVEYESIATNAGLFKWNVATSKDGKNIFDNVVIQKQLRRDNVNNPTTGTWTAVTGSAASGSVILTEEPEALAAGAFIRWVRVKSQGNAGDSAWAYASHAYGSAATANLISAKAEKNGSASRITAQWSVGQSRKQPIDTVTVQYAIDKPTDAALSAPSSGWSDAIELKDASGKDKIVVNVSDAISTDECMWVRIMTEHDGIGSYSNAKVAQVGSLAAPAIDATPNFTSGAVSISITEQTACTVANTAIFYRSEDDPKNDQIIGILPHGTTSGSYNVSDIVGRTKSCFGAFAFVGTYSGLKIKSNKMSSPKAIDSDIAAVAPANVTISEGTADDNVRIAWEWTWTDALYAELAWADHEDAWESTDEPNTYKVVDRNAVNWVIAGLESGKRWFFRVRLIGEQDGDELVGPWSSIVSYDLSSVPDKPVLTLNKTVINEGDTVTARWAYAVTTGTEQSFAEIAIVTEVTENNTATTVYTPIASTDVDQSVDINYDGWTTGQTYNLAVRITTTADTQSVWSDPVALTVAAPVNIVISASNIAAPGSWTIRTETRTATYVDGELTNVTYDFHDEEYMTIGGLTPALYDELYTNNGMETTEIETTGNTTVVTRTTNTLIDIYPSDYEPSLEGMPFEITITGAGTSGTTMLTIVRVEDYHVDRPDEKDYDGFEGETIFTTSQIGEAAITVNVDDLVGSLDYGARYKIIATVIDEYGQTASEELPFIVDWVHKAVIPSAIVEVDKDIRIAKITPVITPVPPESYMEGDVCDIYRITADQPELIYKGAEFGTTYVDPYPAFGDFCGHRLVTRTFNGDYTTMGGLLAWYDTDIDDGDFLEEQQMIIDVDGDQIELPYNITLKNKWVKDFKRTTYLGGSVRGDWNPAVTRDLTAETVVIRGDELDKQLAMRDLAGYAGVAHIRTPDGSSLTCDIQIDEAQAYDTKKISYTLTVLAIDPGDPVGMTLAEWEAMNAEE